MYVVDFSNHRIQKFTSDGVFITKWGNEGTEDGEFNLPKAIVVDRSGNVYVSDTGNDCIQKFAKISLPCPAEKVYGENSEETKLLRYLRDKVLNKTPEGQDLIRLYYEWSHAIVKAMEDDEEFKKEVKEMIDGVLGLVGGEAE